MTAVENTTPRTTRTIVAAHHTVTIHPDASATCTCSSYRAALAMFGEGYCSHLQQAQPIATDEKGQAL